MLSKPLRTMPLGTRYAEPKDFLRNGRPTLLTTDLAASIAEYVDYLGFKLVQHIAHTAALLERNGVRLQLLRRYVQYEKNINASTAALKPPTHRIAIDNVFDLYSTLASHKRGNLSGPPALSLLGAWEFSMQDTQGNRLYFVQAVVKDVFSLAGSPQSDA